MVRQLFTPTEYNPTLPFTVPREWFGKMIEFIAFPLDAPKQDVIRAKIAGENIVDENFMLLSSSSLAKEWDSAEDEEWDVLLEQMESI